MTYAHELAAKTLADYYQSRYREAPDGLRPQVLFRGLLYTELQERTLPKAASLFHALSGLEDKHPLAVNLLRWLTKHPENPAILVRQKVADTYPLASLSAPTLETDGDLVTVHVTGELLHVPVRSVLDEINRAKKVRVFIDSPGGSTLPAMQLYDALKTKEDSTAIVTGRACSAACVLLQGARVRKVCRSATLMVHHARQACYGTARELQLMVDGLKEWQAKHWECFDRCPPALVAQWRESGADFYFNAQEAVAAGLADEVIADAAAGPPPVDAAPVLADSDPDRPAEDLLIELLARARPLFQDPKSFAMVLDAFCSAEA